MSVENKHSDKFSWRKLGIVMSYLFLLGLTITLLAFSNGHQQQLKCWKIEMEISGSEKGKGLITEEEILQVCNDANKGVIGKTASQIDIPNLRRNLLILPYVRRAEVYPTLDGRCRVQVTARTPVARILDSAGTACYMDEEGYLMPLKEGFSADVPMFVGHFRSPMLIQSVMQDKKSTQQQRDILEMALVIRENETWDAQVDHMFCTKSQGWMMIPRFGKNVIRIDTVKDFKKKMDNLFVFYSKVMPHVDLDMYDTLDTRFINQIVGIKRNITL